MLALEPRLLVFVEGVSGNCCPVATRQPAFWGGALDSAAAAPVRLPVPEKLVYSPHVYGPGGPHSPPPPVPCCCHGPHMAAAKRVIEVLRALPDRVATARLITSSFAYVNWC